MNKPTSKLKLLQEQKEAIERQITAARNAAQPEIEEQINTFFKQLKEDYGLDGLTAECQISFDESEEDDFGMVVEL